MILRYNEAKMRDEIITKLYQLRDVKYRDFHSGLCPGTANIIGVRIPLQRKLAQEIVQEDFRKFLNEVKNEYYEETMIEGFVIAKAKIDLAERLKLLRSYVPKIDNWAVCDSVCATLKWREEDLTKVWNFILQYQNSEAEFELRFMLIMMLDHFLWEEYVEQILAIVNKIQSEQYYVKMAQAWLVAELFIKAREQTEKFLQHNDLLPWVQNKAIQKIRESNRVTAEDKRLVLQWKR